MKNSLIGIILLAIDLILMISGMTCLIVGYLLTDYFTDFMVEVLISYGWLGVGISIGNLLVTIGITCISLDEL